VVGGQRGLAPQGGDPGEVGGAAPCFRH
jgi:hypothetical protein